MRSSIILIALCATMIIASSHAIRADIPTSINYQGYLTDDDGNPVPDSTYNMVFRIYADPDGLTEMWNSGTLAVPVENGLFNVELTGINELVFVLSVDCHMGIQIGLEPELRPLISLTSSPYALYAQKAQSVDNSSIYNSAINPDAEIDPSKIAGNAAIREGDANVFSNENVFQNTSYFSNTTRFSNISNPSAYVDFYDSTLSLDNNGIRIGNTGDPLSYSPLTIERHFNIASPNSRYGGLTHVYNAGTGTIFGMWSRADRTSSAATTKYTYGLYGVGANDYSVGTAVGVFGYASGGAYTYGVYGDVNGTNLEQEYAGYFMGDVGIQGQIIYVISGYRIDHPLDPENKYLYHSAVESPDMKNVYDGVVTLDANGSASVKLPDYFEALNRDFRYQLTCIGGYAPVYIAEEINNNRFVISGGEPGMKVSWMVTGIRKDPFAESRRIQPEREKPAFERGLYLFPEGYGYGEEKSINYEAIRQAREAAQGGNGE